MDWLGILTIVFIIIVLVLSMIAANRRIMSPVDAATAAETADIPKFSVPVQWDPYPSGGGGGGEDGRRGSVTIENRFDCNARSLRVCDMNDPSTLFGCRELSVRCHHFDTDRQYFENGRETTIPKNATPNEGYALAITSLASACNVYHGDLVLVDKNPNANEYMLICNCKQPGLIGNDNILGACTSVYVCNGKVDSIDKPLDQIQCVCRAHERATRYADDGVPVCKTMLVHEANAAYKDWTHLVPWSSGRLLSTEMFNATVRDNTSVQLLLDPCRNAIDDPTTEILNAEYSWELKSCKFKDYGVPLRVGMLDTFDAERAESDRRVAGTPTPYKALDAVLASDKHQAIRLTDHVAGKRMLINVRTRLNAYKSAVPEVYVNLPESVGFSSEAQFYMTTRNQMVGGKCTSYWPHYQCVLDEYYGGTLSGIPFSGFKSPPDTFLWDTDAWLDAERAVHLGVEKSPEGAELNNKHLLANDVWRGYGVQFCAADSDDCLSGLLSFDAEIDYRRHKNVLTD